MIRKLNTKKQFERKALDDYLKRTGQRVDDLRDAIIYFGLDGIMTHIDIANRSNKKVRYYYSQKGFKTSVNRMFVRYE